MDTKTNQDELDIDINQILQIINNEEILATSSAPIDMSRVG